MQPEDGAYEPLIGYIPLEQAQAAVDLVGHRLVKVSRVDLKSLARRAGANVGLPLPAVRPLLTMEPIPD